MNREVIVIVDGVVLSEAQATTVRVALTDLHSAMANPNALGSDVIGLSMTKSYRDRAAEIMRLMGVKV